MLSSKQNAGNQSEFLEMSLKIKFVVGEVLNGHAFFSRFPGDDFVNQQNG